MSLINFKVNSERTKDVSEPENAKEQKGPMVFTIKGNLGEQVTTMLNEEYDRRKPANEDIAVDYVLFEEEPPEPSEIVYALNTNSDIETIKSAATGLILDAENDKKTVNLVLNPTDKIHTLIPSLETFAKENNFKVYYSLEQFVISVMDKVCGTKS